MSVHMATHMPMHRHPKKEVGVSGQVLIDRVVALAQQSAEFEKKVHLGSILLVRAAYLS